MSRLHALRDPRRAEGEGHHRRRDPSPGRREPPGQPGGAPRGPDHEVGDVRPRASAYRLPRAGEVSSSVHSATARPGRPRRRRPGQPGSPPRPGPVPPRRPGGWSASARTPPAPPPSARDHLPHHLESTLTGAVPRRISLEDGGGWHASALRSGATAKKERCSTVGSEISARLSLTAATVSRRTRARGRSGWPCSNPGPPSPRQPSPLRCTVQMCCDQMTSLTPSAEACERT